MQEIPFGGLAALSADEHIPMTAALDATNCYQGDDTLRPRNGYSSVMGAVALSGGGGAAGGGTAVVFANPVAAGHTYGLLNSERIALYLNDRGDFGAPYRSSAGKQNGLLSGGLPLILSDGSVDTTTLIGGVTNGCYGMLFYNAGGTPVTSPVQASVQQKAEYCSVGPSTMAEGFSVIADQTFLYAGPVFAKNWLTASSFTVAAFAAAGGTLTSTLTRGTAGTATGLQITQIVSIAAQTNVAQVAVTLTNTGTAAITNLRYARGVNPNPDGAVGSSTGNTLNGYSDGTLAGGFGVGGSGGGGNRLSLIVLPSDGNNGTRLTIANTKFEASLLATPDNYFGGAKAWVQLGSGNAAQYYSGGALSYSSGDFTTDGGWAGTPYFGALTNGDYSLLLQFPTIASLAAGASQTFVFYYTFDFTGTAAMGLTNTQLLARFRPTATAARTVAVIGGSIWLVTDPSSETAQDGTAALLATPFGSNDKISGAQLGKYFYLASDAAGVAWQRIKPDFTLEALSAIPAGATPTVTQTGLTFTLFSTLAAPAGSGGLHAGAAGPAGWLVVNGAATVGQTLVYQFGQTYNWSGTRWLFLAVSPETDSGGGGQFSIEIADAGGVWTALETIYDSPGASSPSCVYCSLAGVPLAQRAAVTQIRFTQLGNIDNFYISGYMPLPTAPAPGEVFYFLTFYNSANGSESAPSAAPLGKNYLSVVYSSDTIAFPTYQIARSSGNAFNNEGKGSTSPDLQDQGHCLNLGVGKAMPKGTDCAAVSTFSGAGPSGGTYDTARLWRIAQNGTRLAASQSIAVGGAYSLVDNLGDAALTHQLYRAGGSPPPCNAMAALSGRIICGGDPSNPNRVSISSFVPFGQTADPFPQFPPIPVDANADGWSFDISETSAEQVLCIVRGDKTAYILTNEACYLLTSLRSGTDPYTILQRGVIGRRAAIWAEDQMFWAAHDGLYSSRNRSVWREMSGEIRRIYGRWLAPDAYCCMGYQDRTLLCISGQRAIRYDFTGSNPTWSRHTLTDTMRHFSLWREPVGAIQYLWFFASNGKVQRWQATAGSDDGAAIPGWTFSTGYGIFGGRARLVRCYMDVSGNPVSLAVYGNGSMLIGPPPKSFPNGEHVLPFGTKEAYKYRFALAGDSVTQVRRLQAEFEGTDAT